LEKFELTANEMQELIQLRLQVKQLQAEVIQLKNIFNELPANIYWKNREGLYQGCNNAVLNLFKLPSIDEFMGKKLSDFDSVNGDNIANADQDIMRSNSAVIVEEMGIDGQGEEAIYLTCKAPFHNQQQEVIGLVGISINITSRKKQEQQIKHDKEIAENQGYLTNIYLDNILESIPEHLYWIDKNGIVIGCNDQQAKSFGLKNKEDLIGKNIYDVVKILGWDKSIADSVRQNDLKIITTGKPQVFEEIAEFGDKVRTFLSYKNPLSSKTGEIIGVFGLTVEITERKRMEEELQKSKVIAEQANQTKTDFLMNMSHDIRTPLNGILGYTQLLHMQEVDPIKKQNLSDILKSTRRLIALLNEIIDIAYIEKGLPINYSDFDIRQLIIEIQELVQAQINQKGIQLIIDITKRVPDIINLDKLRLHRILLNLVGNAIKFTQQGYVKISLIVENTPQGKLLKIIILDTGMGIPKDKLQLVSDKFTRLTSSNQGIYQGTGLGLWIVDKFTTDLNGTINIESTEDIGTQITLVIPFKN
jgi:two-component system aerobic respiration control sensor histidine kinase ArcB